jgi:hypothetical protein
MKRIARWFWIPALLVPAAAGAGAMMTTFSARMSINNGHAIALTETGAIRLPGGLVSHGWSCSITPEAVTDDGLRAYRNIACSIGASTVVIMAGCKTSSADVDDGDMSVRAPGVDVEFGIMCRTVAAGASL